MSNLNYTIPVLLDEIYIVDRRKGLTFRIDVKVDIASGTILTSAMVFFSSGKVYSVPVQFAPLGAEAGTLQALVSSDKDYQEVKLTYSGTTYDAQVRKNPQDPNQFFINLGRRFSIIVKENAQFNIFWFIVAGAAAVFLADDCVDDKIDRLEDVVDDGIVVEGTIGLDGDLLGIDVLDLEIKVDLKVKGGEGDSK